jgi:hypothetical protein
MQYHAAALATMIQEEICLSVQMIGWKTPIKNMVTWRHFFQGVLDSVAIPKFLALPREMALRKEHLDWLQRLRTCTDIFSMNR